LRQQPGQRTVHALGIGQQRVADRGLAHVADDARGDVPVGRLAPGGGQTGLGEAGPVEV
jgi:hypothetical protein